MLSSILLFQYFVYVYKTTMLFKSVGLTTPVDPINILFVGLAKVSSCSHLNKLV
jgi:hypothetical protein